MSDKLRKALEPCPFCGDEMMVRGDLFQHVEQGTCPIGAYGWSLTRADSWNARAATQGAQEHVRATPASSPPSRETADNDELAPCEHRFVNDGPDVPLRFGSAATEVCCSCHSWRYSHRGGQKGQWRDAETLARDFANPEEAREAFIGRSAPDGWVVVPREPTEAMIEAAEEMIPTARGTESRRGMATPEQLFAAMLAAAPPAPSPAVDEGVTQADRDAARIACRITGWKGVAERLETGWTPEPGTSEAELIELFAKHRTLSASSSTLSGDADRE